MLQPERSASARHLVLRSGCRELTCSFPARLTMGVAMDEMNRPGGETAQETRRRWRRPLMWDPSTSWSARISTRATAEVVQTGVRLAGLQAESS
jgi:hypothetical protein